MDLEIKQLDKKYTNPIEWRKMESIFISCYIDASDLYIPQNLEGTLKNEDYVNRQPLLVFKAEKTNRKFTKIMKNANEIVLGTLVGGYLQVDNYSNPEFGGLTARKEWVAIQLNKKARAEISLVNVKQIPIKQLNGNHVARKIPRNSSTLYEILSHLNKEQKEYLGIKNRHIFELEGRKFGQTGDI